MESQDRYAAVRAALSASPRAWLVTGAAGFIGSNLAEALLGLGQTVVGLDNFSTGRRANVAELEALPGADARFRFVEADVRDPAACLEACRGADYVLHQAALGSVPRSLENPRATHESNVDGFVNILLAAREAGVRRFVYASSSSVYGDHPALPKTEDTVGELLSPYAVTKRADELYAMVFSRSYGFETVGLRYFNVFGPRQDPEGPYAAVIPRWVDALLSGAPCTIYGDGENSRDFCHVSNVVQANLLAALAPPEAAGRVYNVAVGGRTTLNQLYAALRDLVAAHRPEAARAEPRYLPPRPGDIAHSQADVSRAAASLGYRPGMTLEAGLGASLGWYLREALAQGAGR